MFSDALSIPTGMPIDADVCIVGSGPAGLTIARELGHSGLRVVVLESGGLEAETDADALNEIESVGAARVLDQTLVRNRIVGGSSSTWSGRIATFDEQDFAERDWVPDSGWPIGRGELARYFERSMVHLGATVADNNDPLISRYGIGTPGSGSAFRGYVWSYSRDAARPRDFMRFGPRALVDDLPSVHGFIHATVTQIEVDEQGKRVTGVEVTARDGSVREVVARVVVLAVGGIENARLLLASDRVAPEGVGNAHDLVGRYLMDHPRGAIGHWTAESFSRVQRVFGNRRLSVGGNQVTVTRGVALTRAAQESAQLLNCALWTSGEVASDDPFEIARSALATRTLDPRSAARLVRSTVSIARGAKRYVVDRRSPVRILRELTLQAIVEQRPDRDSRVTLSSRRDRFGVPISRIDWRISEQEERTLRTAGRLFAAESTRIGLPAPVMAEFIVDDQVPMELPDVAHPTGTTRMADDPRSGVVDLDCAVHGVDGLFVAGSSVFPTGGHANPTQMIVSLAVRLSDLLKARLSM